MTNALPALSARSVVLSYGSTPALRGVSLDVAPGEVLAVTGPSGSEKSTLLLCLAGILRPDAGEVRFGHKRIDGLSEARRAELRRGDFGVLFQFGQLVPALSWLERFGVAELADQRPGEVSGGQQQRVAVARSLVTEPKMLFADEPTGALDTLAGEAVLGQLVRVAREAGTTVLLVTHDATVAAYGDREVVVRDGLVDTDTDAEPARPGAHAAVR